MPGWRGRRRVGAPAIRAAISVRGCECSATPGSGWGSGPAGAVPGGPAAAFAAVQPVFDRVKTLNCAYNSALDPELNNASHQNSTDLRQCIAGPFLFRGPAP